GHIMHDTAKVIAGIAVFLIVVLSPVWYNTVTGQASYVPQLKLPTDEKYCVETAPYMRTNHIELLELWKKIVVRTGKRIYKATDGKTYTMSLAGTCMKCHSNKADFCDRCHNYTNVQPNCWECHVVPKGVKTEATEHAR
ncbi:MAG TPA: sulfate reduction electron transfer complex DsrMKJOP subunit DsrJ, partial [Syntrophorhabdus sp.]|nr:sulfate reduction electron transfer complex DsrMKJOP subunit DsrJ [Syntrophorhabdus sp.]HPW36205.1 sulfate reduction electron transfer complex DsrMKJOP subunit DsrJ [Syntrophorhabdus sp.]HQO62467.1 sulfate reduction electron transfer complex DsrMKJOP subunit DsrJ [Syntrophorhabdus sp.]